MHVEAELVQIFSTRFIECSIREQVRIAFDFMRDFKSAQLVIQRGDSEAHPNPKKSTLSCQSVQRCVLVLTCSCCSHSYRLKLCLTARPARGVGELKTRTTPRGAEPHSREDFRLEISRRQPSRNKSEDTKRKPSTEHLKDHRFCSVASLTLD